MEQHVRSRRETAGMALLTALALLLIFTILGTAWLRYMKIEQDAASLDIRAAHARVLARAGLQAAVGDIEAAIAAGEVNEFLQNEHVYAFPSYKAGQEGMEVNENWRGEAAVTVMDECAKININYAPTAVLMKALGVSGDKARRIRQSLPVAGRSDSDRRWFASVDELFTRGFLTKKEWESVNKDILTVDSVQDPAQPAGFVNVNTASAEALQAVLGVNAEEAQRIIAARPLSDLAQLSAAAGKDAAAFAVKSDPEEASALPQELAFASRCYRVISSGSVIRSVVPGQEEKQATKSIETVVMVGVGAPAQ